MSEKTLEELEQESEQLEAEYNVREKRQMLKDLEAQRGKGSWKMFSSNGLMSGLDWDKLKFQLK